MYKCIIIFISILLLIIMALIYIYNVIFKNLLRIIQKFEYHYMYTMNVKTLTVYNYNTSF